MRTALTIAALCVGISSQAQMWQFELGPANVNGAGLLGANEVPANASTGSGGEMDERFPGVEQGITYNQGTRELIINVGWGSANGFTDLSSELHVVSGSAAHIHGPAPTTGTAGILYALDVNNQGGGSGGVFLDSITITPEQESDLLDGLWYINVHTANFQSGEIRGQLIPIPEPEHYALMGSLGLLAFGMIRRYRKAPAAA